MKDFVWEWPKTANSSVNTHVKNSSHAIMDCCSCEISFDGAQIIACQLSSSRKAPKAHQPPPFVTRGQPPCCTGGGARIADRGWAPGRDAKGGCGTHWAHTCEFVAPFWLGIGLATQTQRLSMPKQFTKILASKFIVFAVVTHRPARSGRYDFRPF